MALVADRDLTSTFRVRDVSREFILARKEEAPFTAMVKKGAKPKSSLYEWPFKTRHTPSDSAIVDGTDVTDAELINNNANKAMIQGRVQKGRVYIGVSDIAEELGEEYARSGGLMADNLADGIVLSRENMELTCLKAGDSQADAGGSTPGKLRGLVNWIRSSNPGSPDLPIPTMALTPAGNIITGKAAATNVTEDDFRNLLQSIAETCRQSTRVVDVYCTPSMRKVFTNYLFHNPTGSVAAPSRHFMADTEDAGEKIKLKISVYESDFGIIRLHTHFSLPSGVHALVVDMNAVKIRPVRAPRERALEYRGGGHKTMIEYIIGLEVCNPQAHGKITT